MTAALLASLLLAGWSAPDLRLGWGVEAPQTGGGSERHPAGPEDVERVAELFARQDDAILSHRGDLACEDFDESFSSADFQCDSGGQMLGRWDSFLRDHSEAALSSRILHAERVGDWIVADVRRLFTGVRSADAQPAQEESVETHVLRDAGGRLRIAATYEHEASRSAWIDRARRVYDARSELCYQVALPEPFVAVPRRGPGAVLDELLLLDPADDATLGLMVFEPTVDEPLLDLMWRDCVDPVSTWLLEPRRYERGPPGIVGAFEAEVACAGGAEASGAKRRPAHERAIYLSPDGRVVFAAWLRSPPRSFARVKAKVDQLVRSLRFSDVRPGHSYAAALLDRNPRWSTVTDGIFRPGSTSIEMVIPPGMVATGLLGDHVLRLRLRILDDPKSWIIVRVFPGGENRYPADRMLERTVQRMNAFACAEGEGGDSRRSDGTMDVLGRHGDWRGVEIVCKDGSRRNYQIVAVDREESHVQVQVLPGSGNVEVQAGSLRRVLEALRVRGSPGAPPPGK